MPGDAVRHIHWRSTAKTGVHMVRRFEETRRSHIMVALSLSADDYGDRDAAEGTGSLPASASGAAGAGPAPGGDAAFPAGGTTVAAGREAGRVPGSTADAEFELAVSVVGSLGARAIVEARTVSVVASADRAAGRVRARRLPTLPALPGLARTAARSAGPGSRTTRLRRLATVTRERLLDDLAEIGASERAAPLGELARAAADEVAGVSVVFLVCGTGTAPAAIRSAAVGFPPGVQVVAVVCDPEVEPGLRRLGALSVLTIGYLDDLRVALQKGAT